MRTELCVNLRTLGHRTTGVQRYVSNLLPLMPAELQSVTPPVPLQGIRGHLWEQFWLPTQLRKRWLWSPGNTGPLGVTRQILTIHDMASLDHPEWFEDKFGLWYRALLPRLIRRVRSIITVSQFSKERIVALSRIQTARVHVIPNGVDRSFRPASPEMISVALARFNLTRPYLLFVGSLEPRKNLQALLRAWRLGQFHGANLAIVGAGSHVFPDMKLHSIPANVSLLGCVPDDLLPALYSGAKGFVYPSVYEGFGLPSLEALSCGCPVAISDIPAHRETFGNIASYFDPYDVEQLSDALESLLRLTGPERDTLVQQGIRHAASYDWAKAAEATWRVLEGVAKS
jgi:glycosyltransferase involved in cell wall biosynthesis